MAAIRSFSKVKPRAQQTLAGAVSARGPKRVSTRLMRASDDGVWTSALFMSLVSLLRLRDTKATAVVTGECSSAALWPFAACRRRVVTPYSVLLFHPMKWQSEEHIGIREAAEWSRHFADLERDMDVLLGELFGSGHDLLADWIRTHRYVTGRELAAAGLAELISLQPLVPINA